MGELMQRLLWCAVAAGCALACSHGADAVASSPPASTEAVRAAIAANNAEFARAIKAKDTATLTHLFTEDGIFVSPPSGMPGT